MNKTKNEQLFQLLGHQQWLRELQWYECVDSTNTLARTFVSEHPSELPALFVADQQTQGRGRSNNSWWSPLGCLMTTLAIPSVLLPTHRSQWSQLALLTGVALAEAVETRFPGLQSQLKWPNDLYLNGRKVAGILIESISLNPDLSVFLIGMGVNINMDWKTAPDELIRRATCLSSALKLELKPLDLLPTLIERISQRLESWRLGTEPWHIFWTKRCYLTGRNIAVKTPTCSPATSTSIVGRCEGVTEDGQLLVRTEQGLTIRVNVGEVQTLP